MCFTCGGYGDQCGHAIHRNCFDFDEVMNHCQCVKCNLFLHGNLGIYAIKIDREYGKGTYEIYLEKSHNTVKFTRSELEDIVNKYTLKQIATIGHKQSKESQTDEITRP